MSNLHNLLKWRSSLLGEYLHLHKHSCSSAQTVHNLNVTHPCGTHISPIQSIICFLLHYILLYLCAHHFVYLCAHQRSLLIYRIPTPTHSHTLHIHKCIPSLFCTYFQLRFSHFETCSLEKSHYFISTLNAFLKTIRVSSVNGLYIYIYIYTHTHTHTRGLSQK